jgi:pimeloyl-ACP methyl ester carboxylesterase
MMWQPQAEALAHAFRVIRYDQRGHGASDAPPGPYDLDRLGRDVLALADHLELERFSFCGMSMGGLTGQWLGVHAGARLEHGSSLPAPQPSSGRARSGSSASPRS